MCKNGVVLAGSESIKKTCPPGTAASFICGPLCLRAIGLKLIKMPPSFILRGANF